MHYVVTVDYGVMRTSRFFVVGPEGGEEELMTHTFGPNTARASGEVRCLEVMMFIELDDTPTWVTAPW
jgi:hypothetical protein